MRFSHHLARGLPAALLTGAAALLVGCADAPTSTPTAAAPHGRPQFNGTSESGGSFELCKIVEKAGTFTFQVSRSGGGDGVDPLPATASITVDHDLSYACTFIFYPTNAASWTSPITITATENVPSGFKVCYNATYKDASILTEVVPGENSVSVTFPYGHDGAIVFGNCVAPPPVAYKGCTPGYWKQDQHFDSWPAAYAPGNLLKVPFTNTTLYSVNGKVLGNYTLLEGLKMKGGPGIAGADQILMRAAVAALLNSSLSGFGYQYTKAEVISMVNTALNGTREQIIIAAGKLDLANNAGCPLK